jgi:hypothetical protein
MSRRRSRIARNLILATYLSGVAIMALGWMFTDNHLWLRNRCPNPATNNGSIASRTGGACCTFVAQEQTMASRLAPMLVRADSPSTVAEDGQDAGRLCVYGANFGSNRGASTLTVRGVPLDAYTEWTDPGAPYGPGHYARVCGRLSPEAAPGAGAVQLTTAFGGSNTLAISVPEDESYLVATK